MSGYPLKKLSLYALLALPLAGQSNPNVPAQYQAIYSNMTTQIGAFQTVVNQGWDGGSYPVAWAPHLSSTESDQFTALLAPNYFEQTVLVELQELQATGATAVTTHISFPILYQPFYVYSNNPDQYQQFVSFYQQVASAVHAAGMQLVVEATVAENLDGTLSASFEPYYQTLDWNDYMNQRAQNAVNVAQLIQPDFLSLLCEPDTEATDSYQPMENSPTGSMELLQTQLAALQQANVTNVALGAGAGTWISQFTTYLQDFAATSLNYIDMHVYPVNNNDFMNVLAGASVIEQAGKAIGVSEAWPDKLANSELGMLNINTTDSRDAFSFWAPIDTAFLQAMVDCAQYQQFAFFAPSYPAYFAAYLDYNTYGADTPAQILPAAFTAASSANKAGSFTSTGVAFATMIAGVDTTPPATPAAPILSESSSTGVTLTWVPSTDNVGVAGYNIYRNGVVASQVALPPYYDAALTPGNTYIYNLSAFDAQGNVSALSPPLTVTLIDLSPPTVPTNLSTTGITQNSISLAWSASSGGGGVGGYRLLKGTSPSTMQVVAGYVLTTSYLDSHVTPSNTYYYAVESYNLLGITSLPSAAISATTLALPPPSDLMTTSVLSNSVSLSWSPSGGSDPPVGYRILKGNSPTSLVVVVGNNPTTSYTDLNVWQGMTFYYEVEMFDSLGITSGPSNMLMVTTP
jgi:fibronectin type 3 domain-containing protein